MDIKINSFEPGELNSWVSLTLDGVAYDVNYDHDKQRNTSILHDGVEEQDLTDDQREKIIERIELFMSFFDYDSLTIKKNELVVDAIHALDDHLAQNAAGILKLHHAVKIIRQGWHGENGIITGTGNARSNGTYEVTYWVGTTPTVQWFHYRDLVAL